MFIPHYNSLTAVTSNAAS